MADNISIVGRIENIIFSNETSGYYVLKVQESNGKDFIVTVNGIKMYKGVTMEFVGNWKNDPKFGKQFKATQAFSVKPNTKEGLISYLSSSFFPGIGPAIAKKIVDYFKDQDIEDIFNKHIEKLVEIPGVSKAKMEKIKSIWEENVEINAIMAFLYSYGISTLLGTKLYRHYGQQCIEILKENPYKLSYEVEGIGFIKADTIALSLGLDKESNERIMACIDYVLKESQNNGNCYLTEQQIKYNCFALMKINCEEKIKQLLGHMEINQTLVSITYPGINENVKRYYQWAIYFSEVNVYQKIKKLSSVTIKNKFNYKKSLEPISKTNNLSDEQRDAILGITSKGFSVLTGGPGVGKSTSLKALVSLLKQADKKILLLAPTGRASQRMTEIIGDLAYTVHRGLGYNPMGFTKNELSPLEYDFIIIDEFSMMDINLTCSLFKAIEEGTQVLLIGDMDQLPSIGPGNVFRDIIHSGIIPVYYLTQIFRQGNDSSIIKIAHKINKGEFPLIESPFLNTKVWQNKVDCLFIDSEAFDNEKNKLQYSEEYSNRYGVDYFGMIKKLYTDIINKYYPEITEIQTLIPMRKHEFGTGKMNEFLQNILNPIAVNKHELKIRDKIFRVGDRVIQEKNDYSLGVYNGDIGIIKNINSAVGEMHIFFESINKIIIYSKENLLNLDLAYSISLHKAQGSEFQAVILPILNQHYIMLHRNLVYTGLTRAKKLAIFIGSKKALKIAIANIDSSTRQTSLKQMLKEEEFETSSKNLSKC